MHKRRTASIWSVLLSAALLQGCSTLRDDLLFQSKARAALGKEVEDSWKKVEPLRQIETARANYVALHERRLADIDAYQNNLRAALPAQLAVGYRAPLMDQLAKLQKTIRVSQFEAYCFRQSPGVVVPKVAADRYCSFWDPAELASDWAIAKAVADERPKQEIADLQKGQPKGFALKFRAARAALVGAESSWEELSALALRWTGSKLPACSVWTQLGKNDKGEATLAADNDAHRLWADRMSKNPSIQADLGPGASKVDEACKRSTDAAEELRLLLSGMDASSAIVGQSKRIADAQQELDARRVAAESAKAEVEKSQAEVGSEASSALAGTQAAMAKLDAAVQKLQVLAKVAPSNDFAKDALLQLKSESLAAFFKAIKDAKPDEAPPTGGGRVATALILFANFSDKSNARFAAAEKVGMEALALQDQLSKLERQRVQRKIALSEQDLKLEHAKLNAMVSQLEAYILADSYVQGFKIDLAANAETSKIGLGHLSLQSAVTGKASAPCETCVNKTPVQIEVPPEARSKLLLGVSTYLQAAVTYEPLKDKIDAQQTALSQSGRMDAAELNIQVWNAILSSNVQQLSTWASFGITEDQFQKGLNNLFTALIAVGVLK